MVSPSSSGTSAAVTTRRGAGEVLGQLRQAALDGVAGAVLGVLDRDGDGASEFRRDVGDGRLDAFAFVTDHHDEVSRIDGGGSVQGMREHRAAAECVQDLRGLGSHSRSRSGGQDDHRGLHLHVAPSARRACGRPDDVRTGARRLRQMSPAPPPGLEPELSEPKSEVLPITPRRTATSPERSSPGHAPLIFARDGMDVECGGLVTRVARVVRNRPDDGAGGCRGEKESGVAIIATPGRTESAHPHDRHPAA